VFNQQSNNYNLKQFTMKNNDNSGTGVPNENNPNKKDKGAPPKEVNILSKLFSFLVSAAHLLGLKLKDMPYLVQDLIPRCLFVLAGSSDTGKSTFFRNLAIAISLRASTFLGFPLNVRYGRVIYVSTEDDYAAMAHLLHKQLGERFEAEKLNNLHFIFDTENLNEKLSSVLTTHPADLVIIDAFGDVFRGDMNSSNQVRSYLQQFSQLSQKFEVPIGILHHVGKRTEVLMPSKSNLLGSQGIEAKARVVLELRRDLQVLSHRHLCIVKGNYIADENKNASYVLDFKDLEFTNTGKRVPFNELAVDPDADRNEGLQERICELIGEGKRPDDLLPILKSDGFKIGRTKLYKLIKNCTDNNEGEDDKGEPGELKQE
jgi:hypothetical protein